MSEIMDDKRRERRVEEYNDITISVISRKKNLPKGKVFHNCSEDISASGTRICANSFFPVDTLLKMDIKLENTHQIITATGKVKWFKTIFENEWYEGGVEFVDTSGDMIKKLSDHIMSVLNSNSEDFYYSYIT
ncbi:MAG: PilZ domain-containing protein [Deltaproteobacteria bacterium]|nr:PilZ domain-containing protein [Deltaproteobacteria bacterium]